MANRQPNDDERKSLFEPLIKEIRIRLRDLSQGDDDLMWALRRKLTKELGYDERSKPMHRKILKLKKMAVQRGIVAQSVIRTNNKKIVFGQKERK